MYKKILFISLGILFSLSSYGQRFQFLPPDPYDQSVSSYNFDPFTTVTPGDYPVVMPEVTNNHSWNTQITGYSFKSVQDYVFVGVDHFVDTIVAAYDYVVELQIDCYGNPATPTTATETKTAFLRVSYDPDSLDAYRDLSVFKFSGFHKIGVKLAGVKLPDNTPVLYDSLKKNFYVRALIEVERYDLGTIHVAGNYNIANNKMNLSWCTSTSSFGCSPVTTFDNDLQPVEFELEWQYIDDYDYDLSNGSVSSSFSGSIPYDFRHNSTRVRLKQNTYSIPLVYERGAIVYRIRAIRPDQAQDYQDVIYGPWSLSDVGSISLSSGCLTQFAYVIGTPHASNLNWQYTINFAEEGKYKHVINYFDGTLKNRQTQTKINTDPGNIIVADKIYDYEGRSSIQTLPTPFTQASLGYITGVTKNSATDSQYKAADFDILGSCDADSIPPLHSTSYANVYYSSSNSDTSGIHKFVPDAKGYPFTQSIYSPDNKLLYQGGAGWDHQLWTDHGTRYEYSRALQEELDRYFGAEAGIAQYFPKTIVSDPNGQSSVLIQNQAGQTVLSGLIGMPNPVAPIDQMHYSNNLEDSACFNILQNFTQTKLANGLAANTNFYAEFNGTHKLQYRVTIPPFLGCSTGGGDKYILAKGHYTYSLADDCGVPKSSNSGTVGYDSIHVGAFNANYVSSIDDPFLTKGKYLVDKKLTFNRYEINNRVKQFVKENEPICYNSEKYFVKQTVESADFPCVDSPMLSPCEMKKRQMMRELSPGGKYGIYSKNLDGSFKPCFENCADDSNSIFTLRDILIIPPNPWYLDITNAYSRPMWDTKWVPRYNDTCISIPDVIYQGRTYTNVKALNVDTFIMIFNDAMAEALLPLHPEYCKLALCDDGSLVTELESFETQKQAAQGNRFYLDSIVAHDPMYEKASPMDKPLLKEQLTHFRNNPDKRLDELAIGYAYCSAGNVEEAQHCAKFLYDNEIMNSVFLDSAVKQKYYQTLKSFYLVNRSYLQQRVLDSSVSTCQPCSANRMKYVSPPVFISVFNDDNSFDTSLHLPGWMDTLFQTVNDPNFNPATFGMPSQVQDSIDAWKAVLAANQADIIMNDLQNCSLDPGELDDIKTFLVNHVNGGVMITPIVIDSAIRDAGLTPNDLCHGYLLRRNIPDNTSETEYTYDCAHPDMYDGIRDFLNTSRIKSAIASATFGGGASQGVGLDAGNIFCNAIAAQLSIGVSDAISVTGYLDTIKSSGATYLKFVKLRIIGDTDTMYLYLKRKVSSAPYLDGASSLNTDVVICLNEDETAVADGYLAAYTAVASIEVNGGGAEWYYLWSKDIKLMTEPGNKIPLPAITCVAIKNAIKEFKADKTTWLYDDAIDHPLFEKTLANYLNYKFGAHHLYNDYIDLMNGCSVSDSVDLNRHYATMKITADNDVAAANFLGNLNVYRNVLDRRMKYNSNDDHIISINLNVVPQDSILKYKNDVITACTTTANCTYVYLPNDVLKVIQRSGSCSPSPALSTYGFTTDGITIYYSNGVSAAGTMYTYNGTAYSLPKDHADMIGNAIAYASQCPSTYVIPDAAVLRSETYTSQATQDYLAYVYGLEGLTKYQIRDSIEPANLEAQVSNYSGYLVQYDDPYCANAKKDLYVYDNTQGGHWGSTLLSSILGDVHSALGPDKLFLTEGTLSAGTSTKIYRKANGVHWYRFFDADTVLRNVYLQPPANFPFSVNDLTLDSVRIGPGINSIYRFTAYMTHTLLPGEVFACKGYANFPLGYGARVPNVLLYQKPGLSYCLDSLDCEYFLLQDAIYAGKVRYRQYFDSTTTAVTNSMITFLKDNTKDSLQVCVWTQKDNITLYYYDVNGNLRKTVPPASVNNGSGIPVTYTAMVSKYQYDSRNLMIQKETPDEGVINYFYDGAGRLVFSQNEKQKTIGAYNYMLYDNRSRVTEAGEVRLTAGGMAPHPIYVEEAYNPMFTMDTLTMYVQNRLRNDVVVTTYDTMTTDLAASSGDHLTTQENLLNRVAQTDYYWTKNSEALSTYSSPVFSTFYSYDMVGNVKTVTYYCPAMTHTKQQFKRVDYDYDQISGKVNMISYNRGKPDQFYQRYEYDADNRITEAETSNNGIIWNRDAAYTYYKHGPLANTKIGDLHIQSIDYAYTIQGWLKAINGDVLRYDKQMQPDGAPGNTAYARDAMAYSIDYFSGDYKSIAAGANVSNLAAPADALYNGNIVRTTSSLLGLGNLRGNYRYNQIHALKQAMYEDIDEATLSSGGLTMNYMNRYQYDTHSSGGMQWLIRYDGNGTRIDSISYQYATNKNQLVTAWEYEPDHMGTDPGLLQGQQLNNYVYTKAGELEADAQGQKQMVWDSYGKLKTVKDTAAGETIYYYHDGKGNRIRKNVVKKLAGYDESQKGEYYVRDATGNILAVYNFNSIYSRIEMFTTANTGIHSSGIFPSFVNGRVASSTNFTQVLTDNVLTNMPSWVDGVTNEPVSFFMDNDAAVCAELVAGTTADYLADIQDYDIGTHEGPLLAGALAGAAEDDMAQVLGSILEYSVEGIKLMQYLETNMPEEDMYNIWLTLGIEGERVDEDPDANGERLYTEYADGNQEEVMSLVVSLISDDMNEHDGAHALPFFEAVVADDDIYESTDLWESTNFVPQLKGILLNYAEREGLYAFFDQWSETDTWMDENVLTDQRFIIAYNASPDDVLDSYLDNVATVQTLDTLLAATELDALDYLLAREAVAGFPPMAIPAYVFDALTDTATLAEHHIYGSSRLGTQQYMPTDYKETYNRNMAVTPLTGLSTATHWYSQSYSDLVKKDEVEPYGEHHTDTVTVTRILGYRHYELTDHQGNVLATTLDRKTGHNPGGGSLVYDYYLPDLSSIQDYYPFGMRMHRRHLEVADTFYRFGMQGHHRDDDIVGAFKHYTAKYWEMNPTLAWRWNPDPVIDPSTSPYAVLGNNPISNIDPLGDKVRLHDQAQKEGSNLEGYTSTLEGKQIGDYRVEGVYEKLEDGKIGGKLLGYRAYKDGRLDYEMDASDLDDFSKNNTLYTNAADLYNSGSANLKQVGIGLVSGDMAAVRDGLLKENMAALKDPTFWALSLSSLHAVAVAGRGRNIVGTKHSKVLPTQDWINPEQVNIYANQLRNGAKLKPIHAYEVKGQIYIEDGHHRYVAGQLTGKPVPMIIRKTGGPVGLEIGLE